MSRPIFEPQQSHSKYLFIMHTCMYACTMTSSWQILISNFVFLKYLNYVGEKLWFHRWHTFGKWILKLSTKIKSNVSSLIQFDFVVEQSSHRRDNDSQINVQPLLRFHWNLFSDFSNSPTSPGQTELLNYCRKFFWKKLFRKWNLKEVGKLPGDQKEDFQWQHERIKLDLLMCNFLKSSKLFYKAYLSHEIWNVCLAGTKNLW